MLTGSFMMWHIEKKILSTILSEICPQLPQISLKYILWLRVVFQMLGNLTH